MALLRWISDTLPAVLIPSLPRRLLVAAVASASIAACSGGGGSGEPAPSPSGSVTGTAAAAPSAPVSHAPKRTGGSAAALSADGRQVFVAGEDHEVVFVAPASFADLSGVRVVPMPGPPAQIVVAGDLVLVTVRTLPAEDAKAARAGVRGPLPEASSARRLASGKLGITRGSYPRPYYPPSEYKKDLADAPLEPPPAPPPGAPAAPSGSASARAPAAAKPTVPDRPKEPPPPEAKGGTPSRPFDPAVVRKSQGGLLVLMKPDAERGLVEVGRVAVPPDAWGLAVTPDGLRAVVTSAWAGKATVVDIDGRKVIASLAVAREPRGIAVTPDGKTAYVSHLVGADLTRIDDLGGAPKVAVQPLPAARSRTMEGTTPIGSLGWSLAMSPSGDTLFAPRHAIGAGGADAWWGAPVVDALDVKTGKPVAPQRRPGSPLQVLEREKLGDNAIWWGAPGRSPMITEGLVQPRAAVYRKKTDTLLVAGEGMSTLVELSALAPDPAMFVRRSIPLAVYDVYAHHAVRGGAPSALALSEDEDSVYVYCRTTYDLVKVRIDTAEGEWLRLAEDGLPEDAKRGRRLYADARSDEISGGLGCEACHPEGRDDGHVWQEVVLDVEKDDATAVFVGLRDNFKLSRAKDDPTPPPRQKYYPRQTPMLAGRVRAEGPYGWHGEAADMTERLRRAFQLHRPPWFWVGDPGRPIIIDALTDYLQSGLLPPPTLDRPLTDVEKRGKEIFESAEAQCAKCHVPATELTDRTSYPLRSLPPLKGFDPEKNNGFKTPSLYFVGNTAPYFHDGSAPTLLDLVKNNGSRMGQTSHLGPEDQAALVAYLETL